MRKMIFILGLMTLIAVTPSEVRAELMFSQSQIQAARNNPSHRILREQFIPRAQSVLNDSRYPADAIDGYTSIRVYETNIITLTVAYKITGERPYYDKVVDYLEAICSYEDWSYWGANDLNITQLIMGLSFAYDYLKDELDPSLKEDMADRLVREMRHHFYESPYSCYFNINNTSPASLLGNHLWINNAAMYQAAVALGDRIPADERNDYIQTADVLFMEKIMPLLPADGSGIEGAAYSLYGLHYLLRYLEIKKNTTGQNLYGESGYLRNVMYYMYHMLNPDQDSWTPVGDGPTDTLWFTPQSYTFRLASEFGDAALQYLGVLYLSSLGTDSYPAFSLLWYDAALTPQPLAEGEELIRSFWTSGETAYRDSMNGQGLYVHFTCGEHKSGHGHPDQNQFLVYHDGNPLLTDQGYTYWKTTQEHNTLTLDGFGQVGENRVFINGDESSGRANTEDFFSDGENRYMHLTGNAAGAYRPAGEVEVFKRHFSVIQQYIIVVDEVRTARPKTMTIRFHHADPGQDVDTVNCFGSGSQGVVLDVGGSRIKFYLDESKDAGIASSYYIPPNGWPLSQGETASQQQQKMYMFLLDYFKSVKPYEDMTVPEVFSDFTAAGYAPLQHGYHLYQKTPGPVTAAVFKNLMAVDGMNEKEPQVANIHSGDLIGYDIEDDRYHIIYLFNTSDDPYSIQNYKQIAFSGKMVTIVVDKQSGLVHYYTKQAQFDGGSPDFEPPSVPASLQLMSVEPIRLSISWKPSTDNGGVRGYFVYRDDHARGRTTKTSFSDFGLQPGRTYHYQVQASDRWGNLSGKSAVLSVQTPLISDPQPRPSSLPDPLPSPVSSPSPGPSPRPAPIATPQAIFRPIWTPKPEPSATPRPITRPSPTPQAEPTATPLPQPEPSPTPRPITRPSPIPSPEPTAAPQLGVSPTYRVSGTFRLISPYTNPSAKNSIYPSRVSPLIYSIPRRAVVVYPLRSLESYTVR